MFRCFLRFAVSNPREIMENIRDMAECHKWTKVVQIFRKTTWPGKADIDPIQNSKLHREVPDLMDHLHRLGIDNFMMSKIDMVFFHKSWFFLRNKFGIWTLFFKKTNSTVSFWLKLHLLSTSQYQSPNWSSWFYPCPL